MKTLKFKLSTDLETISGISELKKGSIVEIDENNFWGAADENPVIINGVEYWIKTKYLIPVSENKFINAIYSKVNLFLAIICLIASCAALFCGLYFGLNIINIFAFAVLFISLHFFSVHFRSSDLKEEKPEAKTFDLFNEIEKEEQKKPSKIKNTFKIIKPFLIGFLIKVFYKLLDVSILYAFLKLFKII